MPLEFGVFDHVDRNARPLTEFYEDRLKLIEAYDRAGFYGYHCAEHHFTPLGMAPSPSVFLSSVAQRTRNLRFGPLVYTLALYHPLRLAEEICMLDQMSRGRFFVGVGKGVSPIEIGFYGVDTTRADEIFAEALQVILKALTQKVVSHEGKHFSYSNVPMELEPFQKPHPPLWYGVANADSAGRAAKGGMNFISNAPAAAIRAKIERYIGTERPSGCAAPKFGMNRYMVIAETDAEALEIARRAYRVWYGSFMHLWWKYNQKPPNVNYPPEIETPIEIGTAAIGSPETVIKTLKAQLVVSGANYLVCRFAFGDLTLQESLRSLDLFAKHVMPALRQDHRVAAE
jgi:alkanesulfonate monooxygenase SsuD/methylene tetrahydromethanopterin reductase-like flavin-dependent oxidoreductase (luciferase family)